MYIIVSQILHSVQDDRVKDDRVKDDGVKDDGVKDDWPEFMMSSG